MQTINPVNPIPVGSFQTVEIGVGVVEQRVYHGGHVALGRVVLLADYESLDGRVPRRSRLRHGHLREEYPKLRVEECDVPPSEYLGNESSATSSIHKLILEVRRAHNESVAS